MTLIQIFSHPNLQRYKTTIFSKAFIFGIVTFSFSIIVPLLVVLKIHGFWILMDVYQEQADVKLLNKYLYVIDTSSHTQYTWSNIGHYNEIISRDIIMPVIKSHHEDRNNDGKTDFIHSSVCIPVETEVIVGAKLLLFFKYSLMKYSTFVMEALVYIEHWSPAAGGKLFVLSDLALHQRRLLAHRGEDMMYDTPIVDHNSFDISSYTIENILRTYWQRNVTLQLDNMYKSWIPMTTPVGKGAKFCMEIELKNPVIDVKYKPGIWQVLKVAWINYLAIFVIFNYILYHLRLFVFSNQLLHTILHNRNKLNVK